MVDDRSDYAPAGMSKSVRIAAVCEREIAAITARLDNCPDAEGRTTLLRERANIRQLLDFAMRQTGYPPSTAHSGQ